MVPALAIVLIILMLLMGVFWAVSVRLGNGAVADVGWGIGFVAASLLHTVLAGSGSLVAWVMTGMIALWGIRLSWFVWSDRIAGGKPEDPRYAEFRRRWGNDAGRNMFGFFQLQALLITAVSLPVAIAALDGAAGLGPWQVAGILLWGAAFAGEIASDRRLAAFKADPRNRGRVCQEGFWKYSRHPNYFFEWLLWIGIALMAADLPLGWVGFLSPAVMLWLLTKVTGIPLAEEQSLRSRGEAFRRYQRTTSAFVPWFRREGEAA